MTRSQAESKCTSGECSFPSPVNIPAAKGEFSDRTPRAAAVVKIGNLSEAISTSNRTRVVTEPKMTSGRTAAPIREIALDNELGKCFDSLIRS